MTLQELLSMLGQPQAPAVPDRLRLQHILNGTMPPPVPGQVPVDRRVWQGVVRG